MACVWSTTAPTAVRALSLGEQNLYIVCPRRSVRWCIEHAVTPAVLLCCRATKVPPRLLDQHAEPAESQGLSDTSKRPSGDPVVVTWGDPPSQAWGSDLGQSQGWDWSQPAAATVELPR